LAPTHVTGAFACGDGSLDAWLRRRALDNQARHYSQTFVIADETLRVVGYYALATGSIDRAAAPGALRRNAPDPIPAMVLGRLGVDVAWRGRGLGRILVRDALLRCLRGSADFAFAAIVVTPADDDARGFWTHWQFRPLPGDATAMHLPTTALADAAAKGASGLGAIGG
jgi:GNAT superfamily N-acetyltransferase